MKEYESPGPATVSTARRAPSSSLMVWVVVLTLPITIIALGIAFEIFGLLLRA
ncbi:hypothetical protein [Paraburkholderia sp. DHOC27]|uniref:hypothetical protein n=1 Tax=Paraburkholderia sp. DHOC27 TaxID=2303330 RepID=UPI0015F31A3B|nr:hypothetical protein [Paraburkholderia sp. DHOC27]